MRITENVLNEDLIILNCIMSDSYQIEVEIYDDEIKITEWEYGVTKDYVVMTIENSENNISRVIFAG